MEVNYKYQKQFWWSKKYKPDYFLLCNKSQRQTQCFWGRLLYQEIWQPLAAVRWYLAEESRQVSATSWPSALFSIHYCCITTQAWLKLQQCWQNLYIEVPQEQCDWWQKLSEWRSLKVSWQDVAKNKRITLHSSAKDMGGILSSLQHAAFSVYKHEEIQDISDTFKSNKHKEGTQIFTCALKHHFFSSRLCEHVLWNVLRICSPPEVPDFSTLKLRFKIKKLNTLFGFCCVYHHAMVKKSMIHVFVHLFIYLIYLDWIKKKKYKILQLKLHWLPLDSLPSPSFTLQVLLWWDFFYPLSNWGRARDCFCSELHSSDVWQNMKPLTNKSSNNTRTRALKKPQINVSLNETIDWCTADL